MLNSTHHPRPRKIGDGPRAGRESDPLTMPVATHPHAALRPPRPQARGGRPIGRPTAPADNHLTQAGRATEGGQRQLRQSVTKKTWAGLVMCAIAMISCQMCLLRQFVKTYEFSGIRGYILIPFTLKILNPNKNLRF